MEIRARGSGQSVITGQRCEAIEIAWSDSGDGNFYRFTTHVPKFTQQASHGACRQLVAVRMREHDAGSGATQRGYDLFKAGPFHGGISRATVTQPAFESIADTACVPHGDELTRQMHAGRDRRTRNDCRGEGLSRQSTLALQSSTHFRDARGAQRANPFEQMGQMRILGLEAETDHVQRLAVPTARDFDPRHVAQAMRCAGALRSCTALDGVVIGQCRQCDAPRGAERDQFVGSEDAIRMRAVQMQIGDEGRVHHRYHRRMSLTSDQTPAWDQIDTVLLDLDGTLLDLAFDNFIWLARVAEIYAENHGLSLAETHAALAPRFHRVQGTLEWYSVEYWTRELGIDIVRIHQEEAHRVAWLPGARGFLERVRERGKRLVLMTNSHPAILEIKAARTGVLGYLDAAYTSHAFGAPKEDPRFWRAARAAEPFDPARTMFVDDSKAVLHAAILAGVRWVYGVKRPDTSREPHAHEEFAAIDGVSDLLPAPR